MFAAWPLIAKIGAPLGMVALIIGVVYLYNENIRSKERAVIAAEVAEKKDEQRQVARQAEREQAASTVDVLERTMKEKDRLRKLWIEEKAKTAAADTKLKQLQSYVDARTHAQPDQEVKYVAIEQPSDEKPCLVPDDITALVDKLARVHNAVPYSHGVPGDESAPERLVIPGPGPATCTQLKRRLEILNDRLVTSLVHHRGLTEYVEQERAINAAFHVHQREIAE